MRACVVWEWKGDWKGGCGCGCESGCGVEGK